MMVGHLKHEGIVHSSSDLLKMGASWSAQVLRQAGGDTLSGPGAFLLFILKT